MTYQPLLTQRQPHPLHPTLHLLPTVPDEIIEDANRREQTEDAEETLHRNIETTHPIPGLYSYAHTLTYTCEHAYTLNIYMNDTPTYSVCYISG